MGFMPMLLRSARVSRDPSPTPCDRPLASGSVCIHRHSCCAEGKQHPATRQEQPARQNCDSVQGNQHALHAITTASTTTSLAPALAAGPRHPRWLPLNPRANCCWLRCRPPPLPLPAIPRGSLLAAAPRHLQARQPAPPCKRARMVNVISRIDGLVTIHHAVAASLLPLLPLSPWQPPPAPPRLA